LLPGNPAISESKERNPSLLPGNPAISESNAAKKGKIGTAAFG